MLKDEAERYCTDHIFNDITSVDEAFHRMETHFITPAHRDTYITEWNILRFSDFKIKDPSKTPAQHLDLLFQKARDQQSMLDPAYHSPLLPRDCIINAIKSESFYTSLLTTTLPQNPNVLHTRLHQFIRQQDTVSPPTTVSTKPDPSKQLYDSYKPEESKLDSYLPLDSFDVLYNDRGQPFFKRRIMHGSSSPSTSNYGGRSSFPHRFSQFRPRRHDHTRPTFAQPLKLRDRAGNIMNCSYCNSLFHLIGECPDRLRLQPNTHYNDRLPENDVQVEEPSHVDFDTFIDDYNLSSATDPQEQDHNENLYMCLAHNQDPELRRHPHFSVLHTSAVIKPTDRDVLTRYPNINPNLQVAFHGFCFDEDAPQSVTGANQRFAYLSTFHLPSEYHNIYQLNSTITFGGTGKQRVEVTTIGCVHIRVPLPGQSYFNYHSLLIQNDVPMLFGLSIQAHLHTFTSNTLALHPLTTNSSMSPSH